MRVDATLDRVPDLLPGARGEPLHQRAEPPHLREAVVEVLAGRGVAVDDELRTALAAVRDPGVASSAEILAALRA